MLRKEEAEEFAKNNGKVIQFDASKRPQFKKMIDDGFKPGWNYGAGKYFGGPREKAKYLAKHGMEEMGREKPELKGPVTNAFDHETIEEIIRNTDAKIDGVMIDHLVKNGPSLDFQEAPEDLENVPAGGYVSEYENI